MFHYIRAESYWSGIIFLIWNLRNKRFHFFSFSTLCNLTYTTDYETNTDIPKRTKKVTQHKIIGPQKKLPWKQKTFICTVMTMIQRKKVFVLNYYSWWSYWNYSYIDSHSMQIKFKLLRWVQGIISCKYEYKEKCYISYFLEIGPTALKRNEKKIAKRVYAKQKHLLLEIHY